MKLSRIYLLALIPALIMAFLAGTAVNDPNPSAIVTQQSAVKEDFEWGSFYTYYQDETYGTKDALAGVAVINPGMEIHPPHVHAEEEYMMVTEGQGTWHLNGESVEAKAGDMLYAAPWDIHGITNTGTTPLTFVVWKWNNKGVELPAQPQE